MKIIFVALLISSIALNFIPAREASSEFNIVKFDISDTAEIDNEYVRVYKNYAACQTAQTPGFGTRVIVALTNVNIESSMGAVNLERGQIAVFLSNESYESPTGEYFEVAFKTNYPPLKSPEEWIEPIKNTIIYEDEQFRVFEERLEPGDDRELHSHAQRIVVRLNEVKLTDPRFNPSGTSKGWYSDSEYSEIC